MNLVLLKKTVNDLSYEFVERKGLGHPDTLSDGLAEYLSRQYSLYTKEKFNAILHHNFDKVGLLGGSSSVGFGYGQLVKPIRVLLNGRASTKFAGEEINLRELLIRWATNFMISNLPIKDPDTDLEFHYNLSTQSSPGKIEESKNIEKSPRKYWFEPRGFQDIPELKRLFSNDTSMGVGFAPFSKLESAIIFVESMLNGRNFKEKNPWIGSDIKIMGFKHEDDYEITICIPQIGSEVNSIEHYKKNLDIARNTILEILQNHGIRNCNLSINTRDNYESEEIYLTAIGSSIESGDEGLVGRGNRIQGFISPMRPMSIEGAAGKNPVYHIGKIYYIAAQRISESIYREFGIANEVVLVSQSGRDLVDPWIVFAHLPEDCTMTQEVESLIRREIQNIPKITEQLLEGKINIY